MTAAAKAKIQIKTDVAYSRGRAGSLWPVTKYVARVNGAWLRRKDGGLRKFSTSEAALKAAQTAASSPAA